MTQPFSRALVRPLADFWLLGGFSVAALAGLWLLARQGVSLQGLPAWTLYASFVVNYPHFAYSYQLFYRNFGARLRDAAPLMKLRLLVAAIVAPVFMAAYFALAFVTHDLSMLGHSIIAMLFFVGWHYAKQGYGVLITASVYRNVFYTAAEKSILYVNAYVIWIYSWLVIHLDKARAVQFDIIYSIPTVPASIVMAGTFAAVISTLGVARVIATAISDGRGVSWSGVTGYICAIYLWLLMPQLLGNEAVFLVVPFFHGLQYLPFVYKYKGSETAQHGSRKQFILFALSGIVLGGLFMDIGPKLADIAYPSPPGFTQNFFLAAFTIFINIHHYFIDHAFWRRDNADAQRYLFKA